MKSLSYLVLIAVLAIFSACKPSKPSITPPSVVSESFKAKYPEVLKVAWANEDSSKLEANFIRNGKETSAIFRATGQWVLTEIKITQSELPVTINRTLVDGFPEYRIITIEKIESATNGNYFRFKMSNRGEIKHMNLSTSGVVMDEVQAEEDDD